VIKFLDLQAIIPNNQMKLSIITINYNNKAGLQKTIDSVVAQTWRDFEWIIIDGGSTDGSKELIEQYQQHFAFWCSEPDKGVYNAMNKGIDKAKGEYMNFMNSGDIFYSKDTLEEVFARNTLNADMVYGDWVRIEKENIVLMKAPNKVSLEFFYTDNICHQAMFLESSTMKKRSYDETFQIYADWARWMEMALDGLVFQYVPVTICCFDATEGLSNKITSNLDMEKERMRTMISNPIREILNHNIEYKNELDKYRNNQLVQDVYSLIIDYPLYYKWIRLNIIFLKLLKKIFPPK
jgi:glycosyltransferase involved in cell wall biosynthesis